MECNKVRRKVFLSCENCLLLLGNIFIEIINILTKSAVLLMQKISRFNVGKKRKDKTACIYFMLKLD